MENFTTDLANKAGNDISVSYKLDLLNPASSNPGDIIVIQVIATRWIDVDVC